MSSWDRVSGATMLMSLSGSKDHSADNRSLTPVFSGDSRSLLFESWASDIVADNLSRSSALFAYDIYGSGPIPLFTAAIAPGAAPGQGVWITWPLIPGKTYQVQFKNSPADAVWQTLSSGVTIVGAQGYVYDVAAPGGQRFYRVVAQ